MSKLVTFPHSVGLNAPRWPFELNRDSPLARGLVAFYVNVGGNSSYDLVRGLLAPGSTSGSVRPKTVIDKHGTYSTEFSADGGAFLDTIDYAGDLASGAEEGTLACWIRNLDSDTTNNEFRVFRTINADRPHYPFSDGNVYLSIFSETQDTSFDDTGFAKQNLHHFCITRKAGTGNYKFYRNGLLVSSTNPGTFRTTTYQEIKPFRSVLKDVGLWKRALTAKEVFSLFNPATRWDLYHEIGRRTYFFVPAAATAFISDYRFRLRYFG